MTLKYKHMYDFKNIKILVVDDEDYLREILFDAFTLYGGSVTLASGGIEALEKISKNNFDIVISDLRMPNGDGISLFTGINQMDKPLPLLFACSAFNDLNAGKTKELHVLKVFNKPFEIDGMLKFIFNLLKK